MFTLAVLISYSHLNLNAPSSADITAGQTIYKVMSYSKMGRNHDIEAVARVIINEKPDILFMQEISGVDANGLVQRLGGLYDGAPLFYFADNHYGLIASRFQVTASIKKGDNFLAAEIALPEQSVQVWNVHLEKSIGNTDH